MSLLLNEAPRPLSCVGKAHALLFKAMALHTSAGGSLFSGNQRVSFRHRTSIDRHCPAFWCRGDTVLTVQKMLMRLLRSMPGG